MLTIVAVARLDDGIDAKQQLNLGVRYMGHLERLVLACLLDAYELLFHGH
jgi:hypothetical protein